MPAGGPEDPFRNPVLPKRRKGDRAVSVEVVIVLESGERITAAEIAPAELSGFTATRVWGELLRGVQHTIRRG